MGPYTLQPVAEEVEQVMVERMDEVAGWRMVGFFIFALVLEGSGGGKKPC